jgi:hypothetical protein
MAKSPLMRLLAERVPITLLCDLASVADPGSREINQIERPGDEAIWLERTITLPSYTGASSPAYSKIMEPTAGTASAAPMNVIHQPNTMPAKIRAAEPAHHRGAQL